ncbi:hypothetical protein T492DRAFT_1047223 [Pavlovales sp. CCMP2436]|nr:hypothetical protein T492DRAFT_1047223 [Pavlovales sp. CCMP2436]
MKSSSLATGEVGRISPLPAESSAREPAPRHRASIEALDVSRCCLLATVDARLLSLRCACAPRTHPPPPSARTPRLMRQLSACPAARGGS